MTVDAATMRVRRAILVVAALAAIPTALELALVEHWGDLVQLVPWITLGVVAATIGLVALVPRRPVLLGARVVAALAIGSAGWGFVVHVLANRTFAMELHPGWTAPALLWAGITGNLPVLAPLAVAFPAVLVAVATIGHPMLVAAQPSPAEATLDGRQRAASAAGGVDRALRRSSDSR